MATDERGDHDVPPSGGRRPGRRPRRLRLSAEGVKPRLGRRLVPLDDVDRFEAVDVEDWGGEDGRGSGSGLGVRLFESDEHLGPRQRLVLLTRSGRTVGIPTGSHHDLRNLALRLDNEVVALRRERGRAPTG